MTKGSTNGKDPAVSWYWNDWGGGTRTLTRHQKGCYMDLLEAQFNNGHLSLDEIKTVLGSDFGQAWPTLQKKFAKDDNGLYYNERLRVETSKRKGFNQSRRDNAGGPYAEKHMGIGKGNGNGIGNEKGNETFVAEFIHPLQKHVKEKFPTVSKMEQQLTFEESERLVATYAKKQIHETLQAMDNHKPLLKKYKSVNLTLQNWIKKRIEDGTKFTGANLNRPKGFSTSEELSQAVRAVTSNGKVSTDFQEAGTNGYAGGDTIPPG